MRPLRLQMTAFGPFAGTEEVDFSALAPLGLFVIAGPTGSGKTTIFDAVSYALYGTAPGQRDANEMRSHHAGPGVAPEVRLDFEVGGQRFRAIRSPAYERPKLRGEGVIPVAHRAALLRFDGNEWVPACEPKPRVVTDVCVDLVGLTDAQFHRVMLLPQGQFERFLVAKGDERRPLLRQLFGSAVYDRAVEVMKTAAAAARKAADAARERAGWAAERAGQAVAAAEDAAQVDVAAETPAAARLDLVESVVAAAEGDLRQVDAAARAAADAAATADETARRWRARAARRQRLADLEAQRSRREADRAAIDAARRAVPVVAAADAAARAAEESAAARTAHAQHHDLVAGVLASLGHRPDADPRRLREALAADAAAAEGVIAQRRKVAQLAAELAAARASESQVLSAVVAAEADLDQARARIHGHEIELGELDPIADGLADAEAAVTVATDQLHQREQLDGVLAEVHVAEADAAATDAAYRHATDVFLSTAAPRLALHLRPGQPCAVCGSREHPAPAQLALDFAMVSAEQLDDLRERAGAARQARDRALVAMHTLTHALGAVAADPVDAARTRLHAAHGALRAARTAEARRTTVAAELVALRAEADALDSSLVTLHRDLATANERCRHAEKDHDEALFDLAAAGEHADDPEAWLRAIAAARAGLDRSDDLWADVQRAEVEAAIAASAAEEALQSSGHRSVDDARAALLAPDDLDVRDAELAAWEAEVTEISAQLSAADEALPDDEPQCEALRSQAIELAARRDALRTRVAEIRTHLAAAREALATAADAAAAVPALVAEAEVTATVAARCAGQLPPRIPLENWVLGAELDRVADAANTHLTAMTNGRYQLLRAGDVLDGRTGGGLDLLVADAHTGTTRRTTSLSGGERFQASLSLALGLADVVTSGTAATARTIDALFVDEGFGSLDAEALDQAIDTLDRLRRHGRQIGIVTHVEAMKAALPVGIEVRRLAGERGSTIEQLVA